MAIIHQAELRPTKMELLNQWLPGRPWFPGPGSTLEKVGAFRFDDPDGEVGLETILVGTDDVVFQVPLSYRGAPLAGAESFLLDTMEHSVLGRRWVYDACGDPCYVRALTAAILGGRPQAKHFLQVDGGQEILPESVNVGSTGPLEEGVPVIADVVAGDAPGDTIIRAGKLELSITRRLDPAARPPARALTGTWDGQSAPVVLASVTAF